MRESPVVARVGMAANELPVAAGEFDHGSEPLCAGPAGIAMVFRRAAMAPQGTRAGGLPAALPKVTRPARGCGPKQYARTQRQVLPCATYGAHPGRGEGACPARARGRHCAWARSRLSCSARSSWGLSRTASAGRRGGRVSRDMAMDAGIRGRRAVSGGAVGPGGTGTAGRLRVQGRAAQEGPGVARSFAPPRLRRRLGARRDQPPDRPAGIGVGGESDHGHLLGVPHESRGNEGPTLGSPPHPVCRTARPSGVGAVLRIRPPA